MSSPPSCCAPPDAPSAPQRQIIVSSAFGSLGDLNPLMGLSLELQRDPRNQAPPLPAPVAQSRWQPAPVPLQPAAARTAASSPAPPPRRPAASRRRGAGLSRRSRRTQQVVMIVSSYYADRVAAAGLAFHPVVRPAPSASPPPPPHFPALLPAADPQPPPSPHPPTPTTNIPNTGLEPPFPPPFSAPAGGQGGLRRHAARRGAAARRPRLRGAPLPQLPARPLRSAGAPRRRRGAAAHAGGRCGRAEPLSYHRSLHERGAASLYL